MKAVTVSLFFVICVKILTIVADEENSYRLPNGKIVINSYTLKIIPDLIHNFSFDGKETINVRILEDIKCLTMNSKDLTIKEISVSGRGTSYNTFFHELLVDREMLKLCFSTKIPQFSTITISISFSGKIRDDFKGLYKVPYEENGSKRWVAATLFEPTYARMVFPCFDEPQYSAKFFLSIARYENQSSSSITSLKSTSSKDSQIDNRVWDIFEETVACAPYLMAFTVHSFTSRSNQIGHLSVSSRKHTDEDANFILSDYSIWYNTFSEYVNVHNYFVSYINTVALPDGDEFSRKATIMIYKENDVFQLEGVDVEKHKEKIARASIHKIYHLWIDAYVRPHWWSDTWLRESLGIYFQYVIAAQVYPMWKMEDRFVTEVFQKALLDEEIHPNSVLSSPTNSPSEIQNQKFNSFINKKGASIINMLQQVIGSHFQNAFRVTIRKCHNDRSEMKPNDLWDEIDRQIGRKNLLPDGTLVRNFMQTWLQNSGLPLITVLTDKYGDVILKQETYDAPATKNKVSDYNWITPITCKKKSSSPDLKNLETWLFNSRITTTDYNLGNGEWILCNLKQGYYRVTYSEENWLLLIKQLKTQVDEIDNFNRAQLIDDSFNLAVYNKLSFSIALNLGTYLKKESDMLPWLTFTKQIAYFLKLYEDTDVIGYLKAYFLDIIKHQYERIGFKSREEDSYTIKTGRPYILATACHLGLADCIANSTQVYNTYINDLTKVPAELKYVVYCNSFKTQQNKQAAWNKLWYIYKNSQTMSEKELILSSLACSNDQTLLKKYLEMTINGNELELHHFEKECIITSSIKLYKGVTAILEILEEMVPKFRSQSEQTNRAVILMANGIQFNIVSLKHVEKAQKIVEDLEKYGDKDTPLIKSLRQFIDLGMKKLDYKNKNRDEIKRAIRDITGYTAPSTTDSPKISSGDSKVNPSMIRYLIIIIVFTLIII